MLNPDVATQQQSRSGATWFDPKLYEHPLIQRAYDWGPALLQDGLLSAYGLFKRWERRSPGFRRYSDELERTQWWRAEQLRALQDVRLQILMRHVYEQVPYYRQIFDERRLRPSDIRHADDLYKLPVLTKQDVRRNREALRARNVPDHGVTIGRTGGTTGIPLEFSLDKERIVFDRSLVHRHWGWAGYRPGDRVVVLRGFTLIAPDTHSRRYWRYDRADNRIYLSGFHLSPRIMDLYARKLQTWRPKFVAAYPSSLFTLARYMERIGVKVPVQAVFTSSEVLSPTERELIQRQFVTHVWDRYGTGERLVVGQQCERGAYHQNMEFGILQFDSPRGHPATPGATGELIQTSLTNLSMPLIRYASDDLGRSASGECTCGRGLVLMGTVEGRMDGVIVTADGRLMPRAGLDQVHEFAAGVERCQLLQRRLGELTVRVVPGRGYGASDAQSLVRELRRRVGEAMDIKLELVDDLPLSITGKERFIVSEVDIDRLTGLSLAVQPQTEQEAAPG